MAEGQRTNHLRPTSPPPVVAVLEESRAALVAAVDFEVEAADFEAEEGLLAALEEGRWVESCTDKDHTHHRLHPRCSERCDLVEAQMELEARHGVPQWTDDWEVAVAEEVEALHAVRSVVEAECHVVLLETELTMARPSRYHRRSLLAHETSGHLCVLLLKQCRCRNHPHSQSRPRCDPPSVVVLPDEKEVPVSEEVEVEDDWCSVMPE